MLGKSSFILVVGLEVICLTLARQYFEKMVSKTNINNNKIIMKEQIVNKNTSAGPTLIENEKGRKCRLV